MFLKIPSWRALPTAETAPPFPTPRLQNSTTGKTLLSYRYFRKRSKLQEVKAFSFFLQERLMLR